MAKTAAVAVAAGGSLALALFGLWRQLQQQQLTRTEQLVTRLEERLLSQHQQISRYEEELVKLREQVRSGGAEAKKRPQLYRIVLTGGPCGGKTTALAEIKARLEALGFLILCLPEVATLLFGGGAPFPHDDDTTIAFQKNLLRLQLALEEAMEDLANQSGRERCVLLMDRGAMDGKAYMSDAQWELMLEELKLTPIMLRDQRYDAILHLVTAADGAESFYTLANNEVRIETPQEARDKDAKTLDCWTGHEHIYIVDNSTPFDEKIRRAVARISKLVGAPAPLAVTRKFLLQRKPTPAELRQYAAGRVEEFEVEQTYLATHRSNERCRVRRRQQGANTSFQHQLWLTETREDGSAETRLMERTLTAREYFMHLKQADPTRATVSKTLTCFTWGSTYWELNSFRGASHVAVLEVEAESMEVEVRIPEFVEVLREVTEEASYDSYLLASELQKKVDTTIRPDECRGDRAEKEVAEVLATLERQASAKKFARKLMSSVRNGGGDGGSTESPPVSPLPYNQSAGALDSPREGGRRT